MRAGQTVVIPLKATNPFGVYANGFVTIPILCYHRFGSRPSQLAVTPAAFEAQMQNHDTVASLKRRGHQQVLQKYRVYGAGKYQEGERKRIFR